MADDKIEKLQREIENLEQTIQSKSYKPSIYVWISLALPLLFFIILYISKIFLVMKGKGKKRKVNMKRVLIWTGIFTLMGWGLLYGLWYYKNKS